ncbi:MAG: tRNA lysidine(34) synthetase TilS, partial [Faecalibacterium prausnitzii]|nr:tRNA lysidine(34) synthetase TilS [Faecalibacterium prausnitzii]
ADRDEAFVRAECARLGVPLRVFHAAELASPPAHAGEDWARRLRYTAFAQLQGQGIDAIATAHTANDQAETLLLRLARGTGLYGAGGIRPRRGCYLRPLLCLSRAETEAVCRAAGQPWVTDETNDTDAYARNRLRHNALPALESTNAAAVQNLARFCEKAARVDAYLAAGAAKLLAAARLPGAEPAWQLTPLQAADPLLLETALHSLVAPVRDAEEKYVQLLCAVVRQGSGAVQLTGQVRFCAGNGCLRQEMLPDALPEQLESAPQQVPFLPKEQPEFRLRGGWKGKAELLRADFEEKIQVVHKKDLKNRADYARITTLYTGLVLRARQPGDRFRPAGRGLSKPLRKWMNEAGVPNELRDTLPLLASGSEILWVCGEGFADGLAPDTESRWILHLDAEIETQEEKTNEYAR